jgi:hypothetical protein
MVLQPYNVDSDSVDRVTDGETFVSFGEEVVEAMRVEEDWIQRPSLSLVHRLDI